jgi:hypothetical protein
MHPISMPKKMNGILIGLDVNQKTPKFEAGAKYQIIIIEIKIFGACRQCK